MSHASSVASVTLWARADACVCCRTCRQEWHLHLSSRAATLCVAFQGHRKHGAEAKLQQLVALGAAAGLPSAAEAVVSGASASYSTLHHLRAWACPGQHFRGQAHPSDGTAVGPYCHVLREQANKLRSGKCQMDEAPTTLLIFDMNFDLCSVPMEPVP